MRVYLDSVGCRLNQSEIEAYARQFTAAGHTLVASAEEADLVVVNTCAVTAGGGVRLAPEDPPGCPGGRQRDRRHWLLVDAQPGYRCDPPGGQCGGPQPR